MKQIKVFLIAVLFASVTAVANAGVVCTKYYTSCKDGSKPINGNCGCTASKDASGNCYIKAGTSISDNAGTITFKTNIYEK